MNLFYFNEMSLNYINFDLFRSKNDLFNWKSINLLVSNKEPTSRLVEEVRKDTSEDGLVAHHEHILLPLELHDDALQPEHHVLVALPSRVPAGKEIQRRERCYWRFTIAFIQIEEEGLNFLNF